MKYTLTSNDVAEVAGAVVTALSNSDVVNVDAKAVAHAVLAELTPESIADVIPDDLAEDVADEIGRRFRTDE